MTQAHIVADLVSYGAREKHGVDDTETAGQDAVAAVFAVAAQVHAIGLIGSIANPIGQPTSARTVAIPRAVGNVAALA